MVVDLSHFETQSGAQTLRNCHECVTNLCMGLRQYAFELSKLVENSGQHTPKCPEIRFWSSNFMISVTFARTTSLQGYSRNTLCVTILCKGLHQHGFDSSKLVENSGQHTPKCPEISFWGPRMKMSGWFAPTTSLNSGWNEVIWRSVTVLW